MSQQWYCQIMNSEVGPLTSSQLRQMAQSGRLTPDNLIRKSDSDRWRTASDVKGLFTTPPPSQPLHRKNQPTAAATPEPAATSNPTSNASSRPKDIRQQIRGRTGYASQNLMPGETILYAASIHPLIFFSSAIYLLLGLFLGIIIMVSPESRAAVAGVFILVGLISPYFAIKALIVLLTTECVLTDRRVLAKSGLISRNSTELLLSKVESLQVKQGILGRIFNFGSVIITGTGGSTSPFPGRARPLDFRKRVQEQIAEIQP
jgi:hypothetical protein